MSNNEFNKLVNLTQYDWPLGKDKTAPVGTHVITGSDFTCIKDANGQSQCYRDCNYTNYYDTTWGATPEERKIDNQTRDWKVEPETNEVDPYVQNNYGVFGKCFSDGLDECGSEKWFTKIATDLTPNSIALNINRIDKRPNLPFSREFPKWQNYYSGAIDKATIKGWGTISGNQSSLKLSSDCGQNNSPNRVRPYNFKPEPVQICNINQTAVLNNQGVITGNTIISNTAACNISSEGNNFLSTLNKDQITNYTELIGSKTCEDNQVDINGETTTKKDCGEICIDFNNETNEGTLDNCIQCGKEVRDTNGNIVYDATSRPFMCCLDPEENKDEPEDNLNLLNRTGDDNFGRHISYICESSQKGCPIGSKNIIDIIDSKCNNKQCNDRKDETTCRECNYCVWDRENDKCNPQCPTAPLNNVGWNISNIELPDTIELSTTEPPTTEPPTTEFPKSPTKVDLSNKGVIAGISIGVIIGIILLILIIVALVNRNMMNKNY